MNKVWIAMVLSSVASLSHATQQAFLIQNSGWMEPFYQDSNSQFKPLINGVIDVVEGYVLTGFARLTEASLLIVSIAIGLSFTLLMVKNSLI